MNNYFNREDTKLLKGFAVFLMLTHHLWGFPTRLGGYLISFFDAFGMDMPVYIGTFAQICVSFFMFLGGYGMFKSEQAGKLDIIGKIKGLYLSYWKVFLIYIPIGFMFFRIQPTYAQDTWISKKFWTFDFYDFLYNFFGLTNGYNGEWWFLISYVYAMISFPLISWFVKKNSAPVNVAAAVVGSLIMMETIPALGMNAKWGNLNEHFLFTKFLCQANTYSPSSTGCFWMGVVFAKEDLLRKGKEVLERNRLLNPLADLLILVVIILLRNTYADRSIDLLIVPTLCITMLDLLSRVKFVKKTFLALGKQSTNMWLTHTFFCYYFYPAVKIVVVYPKYAILSLIVFVAFTYVASVLLDLFWKGLGIGYRKAKLLATGLGKKA